MSLAGTFVAVASVVDVVEVEVIGCGYQALEIDFAGCVVTNAGYIYVVKAVAEVVVDPKFVVAVVVSSLENRHSLVWSVRLIQHYAGRKTVLVMSRYAME